MRTRKSKIAMITAAALACALSLGALVGCSGEESDTDSDVTYEQNPQYDMTKDQYKYLTEKENPTLQVTEADYANIKVLELTLREGEEEGELKLLFDFDKGLKNAWNMSLALTQSKEITEEDTAAVQDALSRYGVAEWRNSYEDPDWNPVDGIWTMRVELADGQVAKYWGSLGHNVNGDYRDFYDSLADLLMNY